MNLQDRMLLKKLKENLDLFKKKGYFDVRLTANSVIVMYLDDFTFISLSFVSVRIYQPDGKTLRYNYDNLHEYFDGKDIAKHIVSEDPIRWINQSNKWDDYGIRITYKQFAEI